MSIPHLGSVLMISALILVTTRCARGSFVLAIRERERLAHAAAALVTAELTGERTDEDLGGDRQVTITGNGGDITDLEVLAYIAVPGSPPGRASHREFLASGEQWTVPGPAGPAQLDDVGWVVWWTCQHQYRWRLTIRGRHRRTLQYVARPSGSAPHTDRRLARLRNTAWPYTYAVANPHQAPFWAPPTPTPATPEEEDLTEILHSSLIPLPDDEPPQTMIDDSDLTATPFAPGRVAVAVKARPRPVLRRRPGRH